MEPQAGSKPPGAIDGSIGEALGQLYVEKNFPPAARARMNELVENLKAVYIDRLRKVDWMTEGTRAKALAKSARFTQKIGHLYKFLRLFGRRHPPRRLPGQCPARKYF